jgi:ATP-dependent helicase HrpB
VRRIGAIILSETPLPAPAPAAARAALVRAVVDHGIDLLVHADAIRLTQARLTLARSAEGDDWPLLSDNELRERAEEWLAPLLGDPPDLSRPTGEQLRRAVLQLYDWNLARRLDDIAPLTIETPTGRSLPVDYRAEVGPSIEARVQEFFGLSSHPAILHGRLPLTVSLLSPARRQIAVTRNLPAFWSGGYRDMAKDMRSQYPKHDWPDDPAASKPHEGKTKARLKPER